MKPLFARLFGAKGALSASGAFAGDAADPFATDAVFNGFIAALDMADPLVALGELTAALDGHTMLGHLDRPELGGEARARLLLGLDDRASDCIAAIERGLFAHVAAETASEPRRLALLRYYERFAAEAIATLAGARSSSKLAAERAAPSPQGPVSRPGGASAVGGSARNLRAPSPATPKPASAADTARWRPCSPGAGTACSAAHTTTAITSGASGRSQRCTARCCARYPSSAVLTQEQYGGPAARHI